MTDQAGDNKMQESWVEVQDRGEGAHGRLAHPSSKEELKQMLACAASEEEEELSDTDVVYQVKFTTKDDDDSPEEAKEDKPEDLTRSTGVPTRSFHYQSPSLKTPMVPSKRTVRENICSLSLLVPVLILTHLAVFGIGYIIGRRCTVDSGSAVMKVFNV